MKALLVSSFLAFALCASSSASAQERVRSTDGAAASASADESATTVIRGTVKSVDTARNIVVIAADSKQEYVLPYSTTKTQVLLPGQPVSITIVVTLYKGYTITITI